MIKCFFLFALLTSAIAIGQSDGYWDKDRATYKQVTVAARERLLVPIDELPTGTTEIVYRITMLDENQQLSSSLVSLLKAIPDPTGISQGSAGAVFLASKIAGDDKCKYALFTNKDFALDYKKNGKTDKACLYQKNPVNREAKRISNAKSTCFKSQQLWFGFESANWILNQRIILEVVPWVDKKLSRGWSIENRKLVLAICQSTDLAKKLSNPNDYCVCVLNKIITQYPFQEYQNLLAIEKTKAFKDAGISCYEETDASLTLYNSNRLAAEQFTNQGKYANAISELMPIISENKANALDYNAIARNYIYTKQYDKALKYLKIGESLDPIELKLKLNLAHVYLFKNKFSQAKSIYKQYNNQNVSDTMSWKTQVEIDFTLFEKSGLPTTNFNRIRSILK